MLVKIATLVLILVVVLGAIGKLRLLLPKGGPLAAAKCPTCGRHRIGKGKCPCGKA